MKVGDHVICTQTIRGCGYSLYTEKGWKGVIAKLPTHPRLRGAFVKLDNGRRPYLIRSEFEIIEGGEEG